MARNSLVINCDIYETRVALIEEGVIAELQIERAANRGTVGNVVLGKVTRVLPGMQAAFIDVGLDEQRFCTSRILIRPHDFEAYLTGQARDSFDEEPSGKGDGGSSRCYQGPGTSVSALRVDDDDDDDGETAAVTAEAVSSEEEPEEELASVRGESTTLTMPRTKTTTRKIDDVEPDDDDRPIQDEDSPRRRPGGARRRRGGRRRRRRRGRRRRKPRKRRTEDDASEVLNRLEPNYRTRRAEPRPLAKPSVGAQATQAAAATSRQRSRGRAGRPQSAARCATTGQSASARARHDRALVTGATGRAQRDARQSPSSRDDRQGSNSRDARSQRLRSATVARVALGADHRGRQGRRRGHRPDLEGADRHQGRARHEPRLAARPLRRVPADGRSRRHLQAHRLRQGARAPARGRSRRIKPPNGRPDRAHRRRGPDQEAAQGGRRLPGATLGRGRARSARARKAPACSTPSSISC